MLNEFSCCLLLRLNKFISVFYSFARSASWSTHGGIFMYLDSICLFNFRKFGTKNGDKPGITVRFNPNFNILVGENDSGKSAVIDAIRYLLGSVSDDFERIKEDDFYSDSNDTYVDNFTIEGFFTGLSKEEAGAFLEWLSFDNSYEYQLR